MVPFLVSDNGRRTVRMPEPCNGPVPKMIRLLYLIEQGEYTVIVKPKDR